MTRIRTLQIGLEWFPEHGGGLDRYFMELLERAGQVDIDAHGLVAGRPTVATESADRVHSFALRTASLPRRLLAARRMIAAEMMRENDLVASHFALHTFPALDRIHVPIVSHFQGPWAQESLAQGPGALAIAAKRSIEQSVYRRSARCIVLSNAFKSLLVRDYGIDPDKVIVSPGAVDTQRFAEYAAMPRNAAREAVGWPTDRPIAFAVRRLVRRMGLDTLITAVGSVVSRYPDLLLMIAGRGPEHAALTAQIAALGLERNVRLIGFVSDAELPLAYRAANLSITPTNALEGFGLITVEAMASGTPAMVTPVGGLSEIVAPFAPDLVLPGTDAGAVVQGLTGWLGGTIRLPDDEACQRYADEHYSWPVSLRRIRNVYAEAIT